MFPIFVFKRNIRFADILSKTNIYIYIKIQTGWYEDNWFEVNLAKEGIECTREQMRIAAEGHITTEALMWNQNINQKTVSGMVTFQLQ